MKKALLVFAITMSGYRSYSQVNNFPATGNVSIGTASSLVALQVVRGGTNSGNDYPAIDITTNSSGNIYGPIVYLNATSGTGGRMWGMVSSGALDAASTGAAGNFAIYDAGAGARLVINSSGNVAIGTLDPKGYKLAVNGSTVATSVTVKANANWPDYVFERDYILPSISEIKSYIELHKHLPDMPSKEVITEKGQDLGEMNKLLLKKVEELTLYLIEKDTQLEEQNAKIKEISEGFIQLKNEVEAHKKGN